MNDSKWIIHYQWKRFQQLFGFLLMVGLTGCADKKPEVKNEIVRPIKMMTVGTQAATTFIELPGSVHATRETDVAFEVPGRIIEINVVEGDRVQAGDVLAKLDPRDYEATLSSAQAQRNAAFTDYQRYLKAVKANAVTRQTVDTSKSQFEVADAQLNKALKALEDSVLRAPFSGRVARKMVEDFANVQAKQAVFTLHDESSLEVRVNVPERDWARATPNMTPAEVTKKLKPVVELSALPGRKFPAEAKSYSSIADPVTRTYEATFSFTPPTDAAVSSGMTAKIRFDAAALEKPSTQNLIQVPVQAVTSKTEGHAGVWVIGKEGRVILSDVSLGELNGELVEIKSGLSIGDTIAISGVNTLQEGMHVRPMSVQR